MGSRMGQSYYVFWFSKWLANGEKSWGLHIPLGHLSVHLKNSSPLNLKGNTHGMLFAVQTFPKREDEKWCSCKNSIKRGSAAARDYCTIEIIDICSNEVRWGVMTIWRNNRQYPSHYSLAIVILIDHWSSWVKVFWSPDLIKLQYFQLRNLKAFSH